jgi:hypothetical protein
LDGGGALHERPEVGAMHRRGCLDGEQAYVCGFVGAWCEWIRPPKACGGNKCGKEK